MAQKKIFIIFVFILSLIWVAALDRPDGRYHFWTLGTKDDLSLIIESKEGLVGVVNPKSSPEFLESLGRRLAFYQRQIDLVVLTGVSAKKLSALNDLTKRYQIGKIWLPQTDQYISKDNETLYLDGFEKRIWEGLLWETWLVPGFDLLIRISSSGLGLVFASGNQEDIWRAYPGESSASVLVGPAVGRSEWKGESLLEIFNPELLILNKEVSIPLVSITAEDQEIVWRDSSWYIGGNP